MFRDLINSVACKLHLDRYDTVCARFNKVAEEIEGLVNGSGGVHALPQVSGSDAESVESNDQR